MSKKFKIHTDLDLLNGSNMVQMLIPFVAGSKELDESQLIEQGRFDDYINYGREFIELTSIEDCDACLLPMYYDLSESRATFEQRIQPFIAKAKGHNKKVLIFAGHDIMNINIGIDNAVIFNSAINKSQQLSNEQSWPHFFEDFLRKYTRGELHPRAKGKVPVVGFCGYAPPLNIKMSKEKIISSLKLLANYAGILQKFPGKVSHSYRTRAIIGLQHSKKIIPNFRLKSSFAFGPAGLNTGVTTESNEDFRKNFVNNILESDYTLCVRGIGNNSIRFFETICCGRIPVFVNTDSTLPFDSIVDWRNLCIWVEEKDIDNIADIVSDFHRNISEKDFINLQIELRKVWEEYLSPLGFFKNIASFVN